MKKYTMKRLGSLAAVGMAGVLALSSLGLVLADSPGQKSPAKQGLFGSVTAKSTSSFTIATNQGTTVVLAVASTTTFREPGQATATLAALAVGDRVAVLAEGQGASLTAAKVMLVPAEPRREHRTLTVVDVSGRTIDAQDSDGNQVTVTLDHDVSADIKGQIVAFIGDRSQQSDRFKANAEVKIADVVKRLQDNAAKVEVEAKTAANADAKAAKDRQLADLKARLEANMQRHLDLFAELIAKAPPQAQDALKAALDKTLVAYKAELGAIGTAKGEIEARLGLRTVQGTVESVNAQTGQVVIRLAGDARLTLNVTKDTQIRIGDKTGSLADIAPNDRVTARYDAGTMTAAALRVEIEATAHGTIKGVDPAQGQIVLTLGNGGTLTLKLTSATDISVNGKKATAADLKANATAEVKYNSKTMEALQIRAQSMARVQGTVRGLDQAARTVTILTDDGKQVTVKVDSSTRVVIAGVLNGLLGITAGMKVDARYDMATNIASELTVRQERQGQPAAQAAARAAGTVTAVDATKGTVTLGLDGGGTITLRVDGKTQIKVDGHDGALTGVHVGDRVRASYGTDTLLASALEVQAKAESRSKAALTASGTLKAIDPVAGTVTITTRSSDLVLHVVGESRILQKEAVVTLAALVGKAGARIEAQYNGDSMTLTLLEVRS